MAKENLKKKEALQQEKINETVSKTEQFFNENKKTIYGALIAILVIGFGILAYNQWILKPKQAEAMEQKFPAEAAFAAGEYELALNGDGNVLGFKDIIDNYGTKGGKASTSTPVSANSSSATLTTPSSTSRNTKARTTSSPPALSHA